MYFFVAVILTCVVIVAKQEYKIYQLKQEKAATEERINALNEKKAQMEDERKKLDDPKYLEKLAREDYNNEDEFPYILSLCQKLYFDRKSYQDYSQNKVPSVLL